MRNFVNLIIPFFFGSDKRYARWGGLLLLVLSQASTAYGYLFIQWNKRFYDALETRNYDMFIRESIVFVLLAALFVLTYSFMRYYGQQYALRWRVWMTKSALAKWLHFEQRGDLEGSDQRIQEDLMRFTIIFERFFLDCFNSLLFVIFFTPLLFTLTSGLKLFGIPLGLVLLMASISYTAFGMIISARIANPLIQLEYNNQKLEAELRYNLVHVRDGVQQNQTFFNHILDSIMHNYKGINRTQKNFNMWQKAYDQCSFLFPILIISTNYFAGFITFGGLMQIKSTFSRIRNSMAYLLDHYTELTELLAISKRLVEFYAAAQIDLRYDYVPPIKPTAQLQPE
jgi:putative ATP-binding cassette transporter